MQPVARICSVTKIFVIVIIKETLYSVAFFYNGLTYIQHEFGNIWESFVIQEYILIIIYTTAMK